MQSLNTLNKIFLEGKYVIVRGDLDVPIQDGAVSDPARLEAMRETLDYLVLRGAKVILIGHLGRPEGKVVQELRLNPVSSYLGFKGYKVTKFDSTLGAEVFSAVKEMKNGEIIIPENLRFDAREEANDATFTKDLASLGEYYVNESFSTSHRNHASIVGLPKLLKSYSGLRLDRELENLKKITENPEKPLVAIFGGVKLDTKLPVISRFLSIADYILLGGRLGLSYEGDNNYKVLVPVDYAGDMEDIGPETIKMFVNVIKIAKTVIWNGPVGKSEHKSFIEGTKAIAETIVDSGAYSLVGGGDTVAALDKLKLRDKMGFVSMGGGAMLEFIAGNTLPGLTALGFYEKKGS